MDYESDDPINSSLPDNNNSLPTDSEPVKPAESVESQIRSIIRAKRPMSSDSSYESLPKAIKKLSIERMDPRINNKYTLDSKPSYIVYIEKIADSLFSAVQSSARDQAVTNNYSVDPGNGISDKTSDAMDFNNKDVQTDKDNSKEKKKSPPGIYGIIAFELRLLLLVLYTWGKGLLWNHSFKELCAVIDAKDTDTT
ncbi:uncharacterized protein LOC115235247 [Formica exsecta]|uniref:uncharacterized protein LOC115235247 n=1 Tax=Formica exsecta TaxID=72781 RepID=UPI0011429F0C|nr:uncharacterized protein LOC115235247 [Formica exsecta]